MAKYYIDYEIERIKRTIEGDFSDEVETVYIATIYVDNGDYGVNLEQDEFNCSKEAESWSKETVKYLKKKGMDYLRKNYEVNI
jgi:hypothetical protein